MANALSALKSLRSNGSNGARKGPTIEPVGPTREELREAWAAVRNAKDDDEALEAMLLFKRMAEDYED